MPYPQIDVYKTGQNINRIRKERGISIEDMMHYFGFNNPTSLYKWFSGKSLPTLDNMFALSVLLDTPINTLLVAYSEKIAM